MPRARRPAELRVSLSSPSPWTAGSTARATRRRFVLAASGWLVAVFLVGVPALARPVGAPGAAAAPAAPDAVVLLIGDGLGANQLALARWALTPGGGRFSFEHWPVLGLMSTWSASNAVTDSGASATAMAAGIKTSNQRIGMDPDGVAVRSIAELVQAAGWRVGYVTTTAITHATPASFYAHVPDRYADEAEIAVQLLAHRPDVALGGGLGKFLPVDAMGERRDGRDLVAEAAAAGTTVWTRGSDRTARPERLLGLFAFGHLGYQIDEQRYPPERRDPSLAELTRIALDILGRAPFLLVVEGGRIDQAEHDFDAMGSVLETAGFAAAVAEVERFRDRRPGTLAVLTADHATGGLALNDFVDWEALARQRASVEWMADRLRSTDAGVELVAEQTGFTDLSEAELEPVRREVDSYEAKRALGRVLARRHGVTWIPRISLDTKGHTGEDVPLWAVGPGAELFAGALDNREVAHFLAGLLGRDGALAVPAPERVVRRLAAWRAAGAAAPPASPERPVPVRAVRDGR
jgi:alkaline phosphatase